MSTPKLLTPEETQALFNFPPHIKFKFDWPDHDILRFELEEDLYLEFIAETNNPGYKRYIFRDKNSNPHNPYGPAAIWEDGSIYYLIHGVSHRLDGPSGVNCYSGHEKAVEYYIENNEYPSELEYWCAVTEYKLVIISPNRKYTKCLTATSKTGFLNTSTFSTFLLISIQKLFSTWNPENTIS